jgi:hypothetical protein
MSEIEAARIDLASEETEDRAATDGAENCVSDEQIKEEDFVFAVRFARFLNGLREVDPTAVQALVCNRVPVNDAVKDDPRFKIFDQYGASLIGVLNGFLHKDVALEMETADNVAHVNWTIGKFGAWIRAA